MKAKGEIKPKERTKGLTEVRDHVTTGKPLESIYSSYKDLTFSEIKDKLKGLSEAVVKNPQSAAARTELAFTFALYRDLSYGVAGRKFLFTLDLSNKMRDIHEGCNIGRNALIS